MVLSRVKWTAGLIFFFYEKYYHFKLPKIQTKDRIGQVLSAFTRYWQAVTHKPPLLPVLCDLGREQTRTAEVELHKGENSHESGGV
jgi:hypothetical protein